MVVKPLELGIEAFAGGLRSVGVEQAYGPAIISFTLGTRPPEPPDAGRRVHPMAVAVARDETITGLTPLTRRWQP